MLLEIGASRHKNFGGLDSANRNNEGFYEANQDIADSYLSFHSFPSAKTDGNGLCLPSF